MFKVVKQNEAHDYAVDACFVRLDENGCYVPCDRDKATGVCVKSHGYKRMTETTEDGEEKEKIVASFEDIVYRFGEGEMRDTEPVCEITEHDDTEIFAENKDNGEEISMLGTAISVLSNEKIADRYPTFEAGVDYEAGQLLIFEGVLYTVLQAHTSQEGWTPTLAPSLFAVVLSSRVTGEINEWVQPDSTNAYMKGDKVVQNGNLYESTIDNNVWSPEAYPAGWELIEV